MRALLLSFIFVLVAMSAPASAKTEAPIDIKVEQSIVRGFNHTTYNIVAKVDSVTINEVKVNRKTKEVYGSFPDKMDASGKLILPITLEFAQSVFFSPPENMLEIEVKTNLGDFVFKPN